MGDNRVRIVVMRAYSSVRKRGMGNAGDELGF